MSYFKSYCKTQEASVESLDGVVGQVYLGYSQVARENARCTSK
jgi:hypothetical protein